MHFSGCLCSCSFSRCWRELTIGVVEWSFFLSVGRRTESAGDQVLFSLTVSTLWLTSSANLEASYLSVSGHCKGAYRIFRYGPIHMNALVIFIIKSTPTHLQCSTQQCAVRVCCVLWCASKTWCRNNFRQPIPMNRLTWRQCTLTCGITRINNAATDCPGVNGP